MASMLSRPSSTDADSSSVSLTDSFDDRLESLTIKLASSLKPVAVFGPDISAFVRNKHDASLAVLGHRQLLYKTACSSRVLGNNLVIVVRNPLHQVERFGHHRAWLPRVVDFSAVTVPKGRRVPKRHGGQRRFPLTQPSERFSKFGRFLIR